MFGPFGMQEMLVVAGIALLIFGPAQLPKLGRSLGESIKEFGKAGKELGKAVSGEDDDADGAK